MVKLRKKYDIFVYGDYKLLEASHPDIYVFTRTMKEDKILVILNFTNHTSSIKLLEISEINEALINNYITVEISNDSIQLKPYQAVIFKPN